MKKLMHNAIALVLLGMAGLFAVFPVLRAPETGKRELVDATKAGSDPIAALKALNQDEREQLKTREANFFLAEPLDLQALQNMIVLRELDARKAEAEAIALALAAYSRRSVASQLAAVQIELEKKNFASAFSRLDTVLRARPELGKQLHPIFLQATRDETARQALAELLASEPTWRQDFYHYVLEADASGSSAYQLLSGIRRVKGNIRDTEKRAVVLKLLYAKQYDQAYFVWLDLLPQSDLVLVKNVFDGGFVSEPKAMYFDWTIYARKTARVAVGPRDGKPADRVLKLDFFEDEAGGPYVSQWLRLQPGAYSLEFDVLVETLKSETGLIWRLVCVGSGAVVSESAPILEKGPWETRKTTLTVPEDGCATQSLSLENRGRAALDQKLSGRLAFDNIAIKNANASTGANPETDQPN
jgi:hypothetical protein